MSEPTLISIEVSGGICYYEVLDRGHPVVVRFKDHDDIEAGDADVWSYKALNVDYFSAD